MRSRQALEPELDLMSRLGRLLDRGSSVAINIDLYTLKRHFIKANEYRSGNRLVIDQFTTQHEVTFFRSCIVSNRSINRSMPAGER